MNKASVVFGQIENAKDNWLGTSLAARTAATVQRLSETFLKRAEEEGLRVRQYSRPAGGVRSECIRLKIRAEFDTGIRSSVYVYPIHVRYPIPFAKSGSGSCSFAPTPDT